MTISRRRFIAITAGATLGASKAFAADAGGARWQGTALGAHADIRLLGLPRGEAESLLRQARAEIDRLENEFSLYRADSALSRLNAEGRLDAPGPDMLVLMSLVSSVHYASGGAFDPTVQPLWRAYAENRGRPAPETLEALLPRVGWERVVYAPRRVRLPQGAALTFNGIAQGYVTDSVTRLLRQAGLRHALVEVGEISAIGPTPEGAPWRVGLAGRSASDGLDLADMSISTSAAAGTLIGGQGAGHVIDPRSGSATGSAWRQVSVLHRSAGVADGLSTACVLLDTPEIAAMLEGFPGAVFIGVRPDDSVIRL